MGEVFLSIGLDICGSAQPVRFAHLACKAMPQGLEDQRDTIRLFAEQPLEGHSQIAGAQQRDAQGGMVPDKTGLIAQHQVIDPQRTLEMGIVG